MRYRDAAHVDVLGFYARRPAAGKAYRLIGHLGVATALACGWRPACLWSLTVLLLLVWLGAWLQIVGTLWRSSLVAALLLCALKLTCLHCCAAGACPFGAGACPMGMTMECCK